MKRFWIGTVMLMVGTMGAAQSMGAQTQAGGAAGSHEAVPSSRETFGGECGIGDTSPQRALRFTRSSDGKWMAIGANKTPAAGGNMAARVWHEGKWMVDLHDAPGPSSPVIHTGQMCFDGRGRISLMIDRYMELAQCRCMRFTSLAFAADGKVTRREQTFVNVLTNAPMDTPDAAKGFPGVWDFRSVEQLPFYSLMKK